MSPKRLIVGIKGQIFAKQPPVVIPPDCRACLLALEPSEALARLSSDEIDAVLEVGRPLVYGEPERHQMLRERVWHARIGARQEPKARGAVRRNQRNPPGPYSGPPFGLVDLDHNGGLR